MRRVKLNDGKRTLGVINNVTASYREKETLLFERNFDALCGIYNRRAFRKSSPNCSKTADSASARL